MAGGYVFFTWDCCLAVLHHGISGRATLAQAYAIGVRSLPVLVTMAVFVGSNLAIQGYSAFRPLGAEGLTGMFVSLAGIREVCPLLAGTMVAAKAGTEIAAHIAVMRTKEQIDALEVMAINPYAELIAPRFAAILLTMPALTLLAIGIAIVSSWAVAVGQLGMDAGDYRHYLFSNMKVFDFGVAVLKAAIFGAVITTVSGYFGFTSTRGPEGVGQATNRAIIVICVVCVGINYLVTSVMYQ